MNYNEFKKASQMIFSVTKMDVRLHDTEGNIQFQSINLSIPTFIESREKECEQIHEQLNQHTQSHYYHHQNAFGLEFIAIGLWKTNSFLGSIVVGPFISSTSILDLIKDIIYKNNLPISQRKQLEDFYHSLPVLTETEYQHIGELLVNLCHEPLIHAKKISSPTNKLIIDKTQLYLTIEEDKQLIEERYEQQNHLMDAIARGDKEEVQLRLHAMGNILDFSNRIPENPIRSSKNIAFVSNTLFRLAAEKAGVHPVYLHNLSERFAILIERTTTLPLLKNLMNLMANEYCDLVNSYATSQYSPIVKNSVYYIQLNLGKSLTLKTIAENIHVNPSHLSRKFKEDTGVSITDFINQKRIDEAKLYLQRGYGSITDIAFMAGFNDLNYFGKVFKKITGLTPSQYSKQMNWN